MRNILQYSFVFYTFEFESSKITTVSQVPTIIIIFQDTFTSMRDLYYKNGDGFLLVYSITDSSSIDDVKERFNSILTVRVNYVGVL